MEYNVGELLVVQDRGIQAREELYLDAESPLTEAPQSCWRHFRQSEVCVGKGGM